MTFLPVEGKMRRLIETVLWQDLKAAKKISQGFFQYKYPEKHQEDSKCKSQASENSELEQFQN